MKVNQKFNCHLLTKPHYHSQRLQNCCIMTSQQKYGEGNGTPLQYSCLENPMDVVFVYFCPLFTEEGFLISPCYSLELCIQMGISLLFSFAFSLTSFSAICKASLDSHFAFLHFFFWGWSWWLLSVQCHEPMSIVLQALSLSDLLPWICLSFLLYNHYGFDLGHTWMVSNCLRPHGWSSARILCLWYSPGKNTAVGCHSPLQGIFLTQEFNPGLLICRQIQWFSLLSSI